MKAVKDKTEETELQKAQRLLAEDRRTRATAAMRDYESLVADWKARHNATLTHRVQLNENNTLSVNVLIDVK